MPLLKIDLLVVTPMGMLIVYRDSLWEFRVLSPEAAIYGHTSSYYTVEAAERAGRQWVGLDGSTSMTARIKGFALILKIVKMSFRNPVKKR